VPLLISFAVVPALIATFFMSETKAVASDDYTSEINNTFWTKIVAVLRLSLARPFYILFTTPSIIVLSLATGAATATQFALYRSLPQILTPIFEQARIEQEFSFFSLAVGQVVGLASILIYFGARSRSTSSNEVNPTMNDLISEKMANGTLPFTPGYRLIPVLPIIVLLPLSLAFFALTVNPDYSVFVPLSFLIIFATCSFVLFVSGLLHISEQAKSENTSPSLSAYMLVVYAMSAGLSVVFNKILEILKLKGTFGVIAGATAVFTIGVLILWICLRRRKTKS
jgi:hypothetical protein